MIDTESIPNFAGYTNRGVSLDETVLVQIPSQQANEQLLKQLADVTQHIHTFQQHELADSEGCRHGVVEHQRRFALQQVKSGFESLTKMLESPSNRNNQGSQSLHGDAERIRETLSMKDTVGLNRTLFELLSHLATVYSRFGMHEEAAIRGEECLAIVRLLFPSKPKQRVPGSNVWIKPRFRTLASLARNHLLSAHYKKSTSFGCEAIGLLRHMRSSAPEQYRKNCAELLPDLMEAFHRDGQHALCVVYGMDAFDVFKSLSEENPQEWKPRFATITHRLCLDLYDLGRYSEVEERVWRAIEIRRELAPNGGSIEKHLQLVASLHLAARSLHHLSRFEDAVAARNEAQQVCWRLVKAYPNSDDAKLALAHTRHDLAYSHQRLGDDEEAIAIYKLSIRESREIVAKSPRYSRPLLAATLHNLANTLRQQKQHQKATEHGREAVQTWRELVKHQADFEPFLAESLLSLSTDYLQLADTKKAIQYGQEATDLYRKLAQVDSQQYGSLYANSLHNLQNLQPRSKRMPFE